jgi:integron integrase
MDAKPRLLDVVRQQIRAKHYSYRTEQQYVAWIRRFILFNDKRHPADMSAPEVSRYLSHLAVERRVSASTQNQALAAILFLYRQVLEIELPWLDNIIRARRPQYVPIVLSHKEVRVLMSRLDGVVLLIAQLLYGGGLRLMEALRLRVKDIDFEYAQILVRDGKGQKDRATILPEGAVAALRSHLETVRAERLRAVEHGYGGVELPHALSCKYPRAHLDWGWQYVFPRPSRAAIRARGFFAAIMCTNVPSNALFVWPPVASALRSPSVPTRYATASPRICSSAVTTSARSKSSWATPTCARRRSTRTS